MSEETKAVEVIKATPEQVAKVVSVSFEGKTMTVAIDSNKDGEPSIKLAIDLAETADEVMDRFFK